MKKVSIILALAVLLAMLLSLGDQKALGRPVHMFTPLPQAKTNFTAWLFSVRSETWAYGRRFDLGLAFQGELPIPFRMFGPEENDVSVVFDPSSRVAEVSIPKSSP